MCLLANVYVFARIAETNNFNLNDTHTSRFSVARQLFSIKIGFIVILLAQCDLGRYTFKRCYLENIRLAEWKLLPVHVLENLINVARIAHLCLCLCLFFLTKYSI